MIIGLIGLSLATGGIWHKKDAIFDQDGVVYTKTPFLLQQKVSIVHYWRFNFFGLLRHCADFLWPIICCDHYVLGSIRSVCFKNCLTGKLLRPFRSYG